jgi:hypothetical protein
MATTPSLPADEEIAPLDDSPQPISIRKLDRLEATNRSMNGGS